MNIPDFVKTLGTTLEARGGRYGSASHTLQRTAEIASAILGHDITPRDAGLVLVALKLARYGDDPDTTDHLLDLAGYAAVLADSDGNGAGGGDPRKAGGTATPAGLDTGRFCSGVCSGCPSGAQVERRGAEPLRGEVDDELPEWFPR
jgi:hypothetical protein